mmetsp:Transcript_33958/g.74487  ORF Transcript_33958/g.74487 Transcript_33958/m.74487 type:complete len:1402 (+) Transcript_33958:287-4492(+)
MGYITKKRKLRSTSSVEETGGPANAAGNDAADQANADAGMRATRRSPRRRGRRDTSGGSEASSAPASASAAVAVAVAATPVSKSARAAACPPVEDGSGTTTRSAAKAAPAVAEDDEDTPPAALGKRSRTRSLASAATAESDNESAGPTIAGPVIEVVDPESIEAMQDRGGAQPQGGDDAPGLGAGGGRDRLLSYATTSTGIAISAFERERLLSFAASDAGGISAADSLGKSSVPAGNVAGAGAEGAASSGTTGRSRKLSIDLSLRGSDPHLSPSVAAHGASSAHGHDPVVDTLIGTAVDALLGCRPRSMSQESMGSLGLRSRSNTLDLMAHAGIIGGGSSDLLGGGGRRSRSNTLEFLSGVALGDEGVGTGSMSNRAGSGSTNSVKPTERSGKADQGECKGKTRSESQGSHSSCQSSTKANMGAALSPRFHKAEDVTSALDHLDALGETKPPATASTAASDPGARKNLPLPAAEVKNRKNSDQSHESVQTLDTHHQKLLYEALTTGGGPVGVGRERSDTNGAGSSGPTSGGRQRSDTTESWAALIASTARDRTDSWGGMSDISFGAAAGHADIVAEITANALHPAHVDIDDEDSAGGLALVHMHRTPPTSSQASLASGSTGTGAVQKKRALKTKASVAKSSKSSSVPKKIAVKAKSTTAKRSGGKKSSAKPSAAAATATGKRKESASSAGSALKTHSLSVHFPKNMPHGAATAAAKAAAEAATAAGASPAELSAIVAAAMATVSKQLFNIVGDVEKALVTTKKGGKIPPGMKRVNIEYTSKPVASVKPKQAAKPSKRPGTNIAAAAASKPAKKAVQLPRETPAQEANSKNLKSATLQQPSVKKPTLPVKEATISSTATGTTRSKKVPAAGLQKSEAAPAGANVPKFPTEKKKRLPLRKRTDSGRLADFDVPVVDLPAPLPERPKANETAVVVTAPSSSTPQISVDYDAVAAAVDAATSATIPGDLVSVKVVRSSTAVETSSSSIPSLSNGAASAKQGSDAVASHSPQNLARPLPVGGVSPSIPTPVVRNVGPPVALQKTPQPRPPLKKRTKRLTPEKASPANEKPLICGGVLPLPTPSSNVQRPFPTTGTLQQTLTTPNTAAGPSIPPTPATASASTVGSLGTYGTPGSTTSAYSNNNTQSNQKWDEMYDCLVAYVKEQYAKHSGSVKGGKAWKWGGNVPTTYKTRDGKALGRWINNQRSAKTKGSLKPEREKRLLSTGLKWSVLSTNAWPDMLRELRRYVADKEARGETWDGNVPTNYRIRADSNDYDEDKNLGRWINRQRSLYQSGKLKKERQEELERIGLRWSVLSTTSWDVMYDALLEYAEQCRQENPQSGWDGNVPANYKTDDSPPKSLGRWVNRQRSAYAKNKLKDEFVVRLEQAGLKWSVHERRENRVRSPNSM